MMEPRLLDKDPFLLLLKNDIHARRSEKKEKRRVQTPHKANLGSFFVPSLRLSSAINASNELTTETGRKGKETTRRRTLGRSSSFVVSNCDQTARRENLRERFIMAKRLGGGERFVGFGMSRNLSPLGNKFPEIPLSSFSDYIDFPEFAQRAESTIF